jgi:hypothetical protein
VKAKAARELAEREAYKRAAEQTRDPVDYDRASIAAKRAGEVAAALGQGTGGEHITINDEVEQIAAAIVDAERARREEGL